MSYNILQKPTANNDRLLGLTKISPEYTHFLSFLNTGARWTLTGLNKANFNARFIPLTLGKFTCQYRPSYSSIIRLRKKERYFQDFPGNPAEFSERSGKN